MRAVILMTGWSIANAINNDWITEDSEIRFLAWFWTIVAGMDIWDFIHKKLKK